MKGAASYNRRFFSEKTRGGFFSRLTQKGVLQNRKEISGRANPPACRKRARPQNCRFAGAPFFGLSPGILFRLKDDGGGERVELPMLQPPGNHGDLSLRQNRLQAARDIPAVDGDAQRPAVSLPGIEEKIAGGNDGGEGGVRQEGVLPVDPSQQPETGG